MNYSILILLASFAVGAFAWIELIRTRRELTDFEDGLMKLPNDGFTSTGVFSGRNESGRLANEFLTYCSSAAEAQILANVSAERASAPLGGYFRTRINTPRSLAGVLVLCGLLVTLLNLQGSVGILGESFQKLSTSQEDNSPGSATEIQKAMGEIAGRAHDAFLQSFIVILMAALILWRTLQVNNRAQRAMRQLMVWANTAYLKSSAKRTSDQVSQVEKLNELIGKLADVATGMEGLGPALTSVGELGAKLDKSSQIVAEAVAKLPDTINASVGQLSVEVTRDISTHLQHQIVQLQKILGIYGTQEERVRKLQEYLDKLGESMQATLTSLRGLSVLPGEIATLSGAIQKFNGSAATFVSTSAALSQKIDSMPVLDLARIEGIATAVKDLTSEVRQFVQDGPGLIAEGVNGKLDRMNVAVQTLAGRDPAAAIGKLREEVAGLMSSLNGFQSQKLENLVFQLEKLSHERRGIWPFSRQ